MFSLRAPLSSLRGEVACIDAVCSGVKGYVLSSSYWLGPVSDDGVSAKMVESSPIWLWWSSKKDGVAPSKALKSAPKKGSSSISLKSLD